MDFAELASRTAIDLAIAAIRFYQRYLSPFTGTSCRFYPTCSDYSIQALQKYGFPRGCFKTIIRLFKCHPYHPGGYDPVT
jgi:uncharacterized protein